MEGFSHGQRQAIAGTEGAEVWSIDAEEPVLEAIQLMADKRVARCR